MNTPSNISEKQMRKIERAAKHIPIKNQIVMFSFAAFLCLTSLTLWQTASHKEQQAPRIKGISSKLVLSEAELASLDRKHRVSVVMDGGRQSKLKKSMSRAERELVRLNEMVERRSKINRVATEVHVHKSHGRMDRAGAVLAKADYGDPKRVVQKREKNQKSVGSFAAEVVKDVVRDEMAGFVNKVNLATKVGGYIVDQVD